MRLFGSFPGNNGEEKNETKPPAGNVDIFFGRGFGEGEKWHLATFVGVGDAMPPPS
jgi:hypothetical protein